MTWLERLAWVALGLTIGSWVYPLSEFITQAVLGHSPLNPIPTHEEIQ